MSEKGKLVIITYASNMIIPVSGAKVTVTESTGNGEEIIAYRITDENGKTDVIEIDTPDVSLSLNEANTIKPYTSVNINVEKDGYDSTTIFNVQVFSGKMSEQYVEMIPLPEFSKFDEFKNIFTVTPQNL